MACAAWLPARAEPAACPGGASLPYVSERIGGPAVAGSCHRFEDGTGEHVLLSAGGAFGDTRDSLVLGALEARGDQALVARLREWDGSGDTAAAGIVLRAGLDPSGRGAFLGLGADGRVSFRVRRRDGEPTRTASAEGASGPWLKLERRGGRVTASVSADGAAWARVASEDSLDLSGGFLAGLAACGAGISGPARARFDAFSLLPLGTGGFLRKDIGKPAREGSLTDSAGTYRLSASGGDIYGSGDQFGFAYRQTSGDRVLIARVDSIAATQAWAKAGLMFRSDLDAYSPNAYLALTPGHGVRLQYRSLSAGETRSTRARGSADVTFPLWLKLEKAGDRINAFRSGNGHDWSSVGSVALPMGPRWFLGLAATSHADGVIGSAVFDSVAESRPAADAFTSRDLGSPSRAGAYAVAGGIHTLSASGRDIWGTSDQFRFAYRQVTGDAFLIARIDPPSPTHPWAKAGLMVRTALRAASPHAMVAVTAASGVLFEHRSVEGTVSASQKRYDLTGPQWLKLEKRGYWVRAFRSADGSEWEPVGDSLAIRLGDACYFGLAVSSHTNAAVASADFSDVLLAPAPDLAVVPLAELGWNDSLDGFAIDRTEVTAAEFLHTMGLRWGAGAAAGRRASLAPMTGVTWADAMLYANARSLRDGLEPAYAFRRGDTALPDAGGNPCGEGYPGDGCVLGEGVTVELRPLAYGYRLPSGSEWGFAASLALNGPFQPNPGPYLWSYLGEDGDSAGASRHAVWNAPSAAEVATRPAAQGGLALFDMAGNAGEWTSERQVRGGDWASGDVGSLSMTAAVAPPDPGYRDDATGFRLVLPTIREDAARLSKAEKERLLHAIFAMKGRKYPRYEADVPEAERLGWWDWFAMGHHAAMMPDYYDSATGEWMMAMDVAHGNPAFLVWHRQFLQQLEAALQEIDPRVTVPFVRWGYAEGLPGPEASRASIRDVRDVYDPVTGSGLLGFRTAWDGSDSGGIFDPGFARAHARDLPPWWPLADTGSAPGWIVPPYVNGTDSLTALWRYDTGFMPQDVGWILGVGTYDEFRYRLESWPHNAFHNAMGGDMSTMWAPIDPLFYLHHSEVDRIWSLWQDQPDHRDPSRQAYTGPTGIVGRDIGDPIWPFSGGFFRPMDNAIGRFTGVYPTVPDVVRLGDVLRRKRPLYGE